MSLLLRKEIRLILPVWIAALLLATAPVWLLWPTTTGTLPPPPGLTVLGPFGLGLLLLAITPFGQEFNLGTFALVMAQPVPRRRIWLAKTTVLAAALLLVLVALCVSCLMRADLVLNAFKNTAWQSAFNSNLGERQVELLIRGSINVVFQNTLTVGACCALLAYAGGLWTTLAFRQMSPAFWFTLLTPMLLSLVTGWIFAGLPAAIATVASILVFALYAGWGFLWARRNFLQAQDVQWTDGTLALRAGRVATPRTRAAAPPKHRPLRALIAKEFQSHYVNLLVAGGLLVVHLVIIGFRKLNPDLRALHQPVSMILDIWWTLWLAMPLLVGAVAVAEERRLGTLENLLCQPVARRVQFIVKCAVALLLGVLLGAGMPCAIEWLGTLIGAHSELIGPTVGRDLLVLAAGATGLTALAFYASTLVRNTLQALALAVVISLGVCALMRLGESPRLYSQIPLWKGPLVYWIAAPVLLVNLFLLAYANYKRLHEAARLAWRNSIGWGLSLLVIACSTTAIYHRVWEAWIPVEPSHGYRSMAMVLVPEGTWEGWNQTQLAANRYRVVALLPWGGLWLRQRQVELKEIPHDGHILTSIRATGPWREGFVGATPQQLWSRVLAVRHGSRPNSLPGEVHGWRDVAVSDAQGYAIRDDGSLWDLTDARPGESDSSAALKRIGTTDSWKQIAAGDELFLGIKEDGTLWEWGRRLDVVGQTPEMQEIPTPTRIGTNSDWISVCASPGHYVAMKSDGSFWLWGQWTDCTNGTCIVRTHDQPEPWIAGWVVPSGLHLRDWVAVTDEKPVSLSLNGYTLAVVCADGTMWTCGEASMYLSTSSGTNWDNKMIRLGNDRDWQDVVVTAGGEIVAVKKDGTLWRYDPTMNPGRFRIFHFATLSRYAEWLAVAGMPGVSDGNTAVALANDGSLCLWRPPAEDYPHPEWLAPSRIKARRIAIIAKPWVRPGEQQ